MSYIMNIKVPLVLFLLEISVLSKWCFAIQVTTKYGTLEGTKLKSRSGNEFYAFYSIPYAEPPIGDLRFQGPQELQPWANIRDATQYPPTCMQYSVHNRVPKVEGQEDCLYLNIFTPQLDGQFPVMVFIHGGGFTSGAGHIYGPEYFQDHQVLLVTINYRLGAFGFLSSGDEALPGNYGLKDQVAALHWIQQSIGKFGGDPGNVLIFGHSAGAASVHFHMYSSLSKGLFHKAICMSGNAIAPWSHASPAYVKNNMNTLATLTGCNHESVIDIVQCLKSVPAKDIVKKQAEMRIFENDPLIIFYPVVEPESVSDAFVTQVPEAGGEIKPEIPLIMGMTSGEGLFQVFGYMKNEGALLAEINEHYRRLLPIILLISDWPTLERNAISENIKRYYFRNNDISLQTVKQFSDLLTDNYFTHSVVKTVKYYKGTLYLYYFDHVSEYSVVGIPRNLSLHIGVSHADELTLFFRLIPDSVLNNLNLKDIEVSNLLVKMWVNFAYSGKPGNETIKWNPVKNETVDFLHVKTGTFNMKEQLLKERMQLWDAVLSNTTNILSRYGTCDLL